MLGAQVRVFGRSAEGAAADCRQVRSVKVMDVIGCSRPEALNHHILKAAI